MGLRDLDSAGGFMEVRMLGLTLLALTLSSVLDLSNCVLYTQHP